VTIANELHPATKKRFRTDSKAIIARPESRSQINGAMRAASKNVAPETEIHQQSPYFKVAIAGSLMILILPMRSTRNTHTKAPGKRASCPTRFSVKMSCR
jgi:hypothetical protein